MTAAGPPLAGCVVPVPARDSVPPPGGGTGADLLARFPSRPAAVSWAATLATRQQVLSRLLAPPFALGNPLGQEGRRLGLVAVVGVRLPRRAEPLVDSGFGAARLSWATRICPAQVQITVMSPSIAIEKNCPRKCPQGAPMVTG